jgi:hypothetical protein
MTTNQRSFIGIDHLLGAEIGSDNQTNPLLRSTVPITKSIFSTQNLFRACDNVTIIGSSTCPLVSVGGRRKTATFFVQSRFAAQGRE